MEQILEEIRILDRLHYMKKRYAQIQVDQIRYHYNIYKAGYESERQALLEKKEQIILEQETNTKQTKKSENREL